MGEIIDFIPKPVLTEDQKQYWMQELEDSERKVEYCKRQLGMLATERGVTES